MNFSLRQLRAFVSVAESRSFSVSAVQLHVTQPALSASIHKLESLLDARLFDRDTRSVALTPAGQEFLVLSQRVLDEAARAEHDLRRYLTGNTGRVRFSAAPVFYRLGLQGVIRAFRHDHPNVELELHDVPSEASLEMLKGRRLDMALVTQVDASSDFDYTPVGTQSIVALLPTSHRLARRRTISWCDLLDVPVVALNSGGAMSTYCDQVLAISGIRLTPAYRVNQLVTAAALVQAGLGISVVSRSSACLVGSDDLKFMPLLTPEITRPISVAILAKHELSPAARLLHQAVAAINGNALVGSPQMRDVPLTVEP